MQSCKSLNTYFWPEALNNVHIYLECKQPERKSCLPILRLVAVIIFIAIYIHSYFAMEGYRIYYLIAFTEWGLLMTTVTFVLLLFASHIKTEGRTKQRVNCLAYVFFEISWTADVVITIVFWSILVVVDIEQARAYDFEVLAFTCETHLIPMILLAIEYYNNSVRFTKTHAVFAFTPAFLYTIVSIISSLVYDMPVYPILTWKDYKSIIFGPLIMALFAGGFLSGYLIGERKHRRHHHHHGQDGLLEKKDVEGATVPEAKPQAL